MDGRVWIFVDAVSRVVNARAGAPFNDLQRPTDSVLLAVRIAGRMLPGRALAATLPARSFRRGELMLR